MISVHILQHMCHYVSCVIKQMDEICDKTFQKKEMKNSEIIYLKWKNWMKLSWKRALYFSGQLCLTKGHLGNQEGLQESEYPPLIESCFWHLWFKLRKTSKRAFLKEASNSLYLSKIGPVYVCQTWKGGDIQWGASFLKLTQPFNLVAF